MRGKRLGESLYFEKLLRPSQPPRSTIIGRETGTGLSDVQRNADTLFETIEQRIPAVSDSESHSTLKKCQRHSARKNLSGLAGFFTVRSFDHSAANVPV